LRLSAKSVSQQCFSLKKTSQQSFQPAKSVQTNRPATRRVCVRNRQHTELNDPICGVSSAGGGTNQCGHCLTSAVTTGPPPPRTCSISTGAKTCMPRLSNISRRVTFAYASCRVRCDASSVSRGGRTSHMFAVRHMIDHTYNNNNSTIISSVSICTCTARVPACHAG
jgi:hypothetical protein